jgi:putative SOS response-associated peptidase YedK
VCNLYSITTNQAAIIALFRVVNRYVGNLAPMPGVFPDYKAPIVRNGPGGRELATARWGMPSSSKALMDATKKRAEKLQAKGKSVDFKELLRMEPDGGTTNIRNVKSKHWTRWLGVENRCVVPFNSFSEFDKAEGGDIWFALDETRPLACFAGIWTNWTSVRKVREGETTNDLYLPPYSPDFNPIEQLFAKLKALLRKAAERSMEGLWNRIACLLDAFQPDECANYFHNSGYAAW